MAIRSKSDGLENVHTAAGTLQAIRSAQTRVDDAYSRLMIRVKAHNLICGFLSIDSVLDWSQVTVKLTKAQTWLASVANEWDVNALSELHDSLTSMLTSVQSDLVVNWNVMTARIEVARTRLGFIDTLESSGLERALRLFDAQTSPQLMADSIDALQKAEELIARIGLGNAQVEQFLEQASSYNGASLESMNEPDVKSWLDADNRREKFVIRFKGKGN
jgi:hypothetical protein